MKQKMRAIEEIKSVIEEKGWVEFDNITSEDHLLKISSIMGRIIPHPNGQMIMKLTPNNGDKAVKGTYSNRFGFNGFPLHTDTAFWPIPTRYILLSCVEINFCNTVVISLASFLEQLGYGITSDIERAVFKVKTPKVQFYSSLIFKENNIEGIKYDLSCMTPVNKFAKNFTERIKKTELKVDEINWNGNKAVIIDNWKVLHGREAAYGDQNRELKRVYIN